MAKGHSLLAHTKTPEQKALVTAIAAANGRSLAARKANATRRAMDAVRDLQTRFTAADKQLVREEARAFLLQHTRDEGLVGDLLGPGESARDFAEHGLRVLAIENCSWTTKVVGDVSTAREAARRIADDIGVGLFLGEFVDALPQLNAAFFDPCGPYKVRTTGAVVCAMEEAELDAFVVTAMLSRLDGLAGEGEEAYLRFTAASLLADAPHYDILHIRRYSGEANIPMAAFFLCRPLPPRTNSYWQVAATPSMERLLTAFPEVEWGKQARVMQSVLDPRVRAVAPEVCRRGYGKGCRADIHRYPCSTFVAEFAAQMGMTVPYTRQYLARMERQRQEAATA